MKPWVFGCLLFGTAGLPAGEAPQVPARYQYLAKGAYRLTGALGYPEIPVSYLNTSVLSPDGKFGLNVAGGGQDPDGLSFDSTLILFDAAAGRWLREIQLPKRTVTALALAPDGRTALVGTVGRESKDRTIVGLDHWDLQTGKVLKHLDFSASKSPVLAIAFAPSGKAAAVSLLRQGCGWLDLQAGKIVRDFKAGKEEVALAVAISPDGKQVLSGQDDSVRLWDTGTGKLLATFDGHQNEVTAVAFSSDGKTIASAGLDLTLRTWDVRTGKQVSVRKQEPLNQPLVSLAFVGDKILSVWTGLDPLTATQEKASVVLWDGAAAKELYSRSARLKGLVPIAVRKDGKEALLGGGGNPFCAWEVALGVEKRNWGGHKGPVNALAWVANRLFSGGHDGRLLRWEADGNPMNFYGHGDAVLALDGSGDLLLSGSADRTARLWNARTGALVHGFPHDGTVNAVRLAPGGKWAATGGSDRLLRTWNLETGKQIAALAGHSEGINAVAVSPRGDWIATGSDDTAIRLWPIQEGHPQKGKDRIVLEGHARQVTTLAFSADGKKLISGSQDKTLRVWDLADFAQERKLEGHGNWVTQLVLTADGTILSCGDDFTVRTWDFRTGRGEILFGLIPAGDCPRSLALAPDGRSLFVGTSGWTVLRLEK